VAADALSAPLLGHCLLRAHPRYLLSGQGASICVSCHSIAPRNCIIYVCIIVKWSS
jgi:hypothetical protein